MREILVHRFPHPGPAIVSAYVDLAQAEQAIAAGHEPETSVTEIPKPWDISTVDDPYLRAELWSWYERGVVWLNHELVWDPQTLIPACWPQHPHIVNELGLLLDRRWRAEGALTSDALEEWHRYGYTAFMERINYRLADGAHCKAKHVKWPSAQSFDAFLSDSATNLRSAAFSADIAAFTDDSKPNSVGRHLAAVDLDTGEIKGL